MAAPKGNTNAEKWEEETALSFMNEALNECKAQNFDFIGEVANHLETYREIFPYLSEKFESCKPIYKRLVQRCEANCFSNAKKGNIVPSLGIINLKSNHGWTDRSEVNQTNTNLTPLSKEEIDAASKSMEDKEDNF